MTIKLQTQLKDLNIISIYFVKACVVFLMSPENMYLVRGDEFKC